MEIYFYRGTKHKRQEVKSLTLFCVDTLMPKMSPSLCIEFLFVSGLYVREGILGDTDYHETERVPRDFVIRIDAKIDDYELWWTVAHELVHVKQYARNELKPLVRTSQYRFHKEYYPKNLGYLERPWEIEALDKETMLVEKWLESNG